MREVGGMDERFGRHTTGLETITTEYIGFDKGHLCAETSCSGRRDETTSAGSDDDEVVHTVELWVDLFVRMHVVEQFYILLVHGPKR